MKRITYLFLISFLMQGCTGTRYSYTTLSEKNDDISVFRVQKGDITELLAHGNGFPGSWGYLPWVISSSPETASVDCKKARSVIPFREPGVVFGGIICSLTAHEKGEITLYFGNKYNLTEDIYDETVDVIVVGN